MIKDSPTHLNKLTLLPTYRTGTLLPYTVFLSFGTVPGTCSELNLDSDLGALQKNEKKVSYPYRNASQDPKCGFPWFKKRGSLAFYGRSACDE